MALALVLGVVLLSAAHRPVAAHAALLAASPAPGERLSAPPRQVRIEFTETLVGAQSDIAVLTASGTPVAGGPSFVDPANPAALIFKFTSELPEGTYLVAWRTLSSVDGHAWRGTYRFMLGIGVAAPSPAESRPFDGPGAEPWLRWLQLASALVLLGGSLHVALVRGAVRTAGAIAVGPTGSVTKLLWAAALGFAVAHIGLLISQALALGGNFGLALLDALGLGQWGVLWGARSLVFVAWVGAHEVLAGVAPVQSRLSRWWWAASALAAALLVTIALGSHAAATRGLEPWTTSADVAHLWAAGVWAGGLPALALTLLDLRQLPSDVRRAAAARLAARFSTLATLAVAVVVLTGTYAAWAQVAELPRLVRTPYGWTLVAKLALVVPLLALGGVNWLWMRPRLERAAGGRGDPTYRRLGALVLGETLLALAVVGATGWLTSLEPARQASTQAVAAVEAAAQLDQATLRLRVAPGRAGPNRLSLEIADARGPLDPGATVAIRFAYALRDLGQQNVLLPAEGPGRFAADTDVLGVAGPWLATVSIRARGQFDQQAALRIDLSTPAGSTPIRLADPADGLRLWSALLVALAVATGVWSIAQRSLAARTRRFVQLLAVLGLAVGLGAFGAAMAGAAQGPSRNPVTPDAASLAEGARLYAAECAQCHGSEGLGDGPLAAMLTPPPFNLVVHVPMHPDAELYRFIAQGIDGTAMPA
ncbi:MAG: CopD family protein, partial [Actinobacteria bacterium]|nr:CopD family protein [Actinomycetota bacterium]